jgi:hypothetical protein
MLIYMAFKVSFEIYILVFTFFFKFKGASMAI